MGEQVHGCGLTPEEGGLFVSEGGVQLGCADSGRRADEVGRRARSRIFNNPDLDGPKIVVGGVECAYSTSNTSIVVAGSPCE